MAKHRLLKHHRGAPAAVNGEPILEWLELRPFMDAPPTVSE